MLFIESTGNASTLSYFCLINPVCVEEARLKDMLRGTGLRYTRQRGEVLNLFREHDTALTQAELEKLLPEQFDRITLYRILRSFEASGLLHKVLDDSGTTRFALCGTGCSEHEHHDEHVHFRCSNCGKTLCLPEVAIPAVQLPKGFRFGEANLLIDGTCSDCVLSESLKK